MDGTTKVFTLTASNVKWEVSKGQFVDAMAFNGQIPGRRSTCRTAITSGSWWRTSSINRPSSTSTA